MDLHKLTRLLIQSILLVVPTILLIGYGAKYASLIWQSAALMHGIFMLLGFVTLLGVAVISFRTLPLKAHSDRKLVHAVLNTMVIVCMIIGLSRIYDAKETENKPHLVTVHSWVGILTVVLFLATYINGAIVFNPYLSCIKVSFRVLNKPYHIASGLGITVLAASTTTTGVYSYINEYVPSVFKTTRTNALNLLLGCALMIAIAFFFLLIVLLTKGPSPKKKPSPNSIPNPTAMVAVDTAQ